MTPPPFSGDASKGQAFVYLLRSSKDNKYYLGWTTDLQRRFYEHNAGLSQSTKARRPFELVYYEVFSNVKMAKEREKKLKHNPNMYKLWKRRALCSLAESVKQVVG